MKYEKALRIGRDRAEVAAEVVRRWAGVKACAVCAVKPSPSTDSRTTGDWEPVGQLSWKEIAPGRGIHGKDNYHLLILDEDGAVKACGLERFPLVEVLKLANRLPVPVFEPGEGELWKRLEDKESHKGARFRALHVEL